MAKLKSKHKGKAKKNQCKPDEEKYKINRNGSKVVYAISVEGNRGVVVAVLFSPYDLKVKTRHRRQIPQRKRIAGNKSSHSFEMRLREVERKNH